MCAMGPKWSIFPDQKLFGTNHCYYFHLPMGPFHCANLKKFLQRIQNYDDATFLDPKLSICSKRFFFFENYYYYSHLPISPFRCAKFKKKFFQRIHSYENVQFLGPKLPISPNENFSRKLVNEPYFFYSCISTCQKSKSDINLLVKY